MTTPDPVDAAEIAQRIMYELLGRRWVWPAVTTTETVEIGPRQQVIVLHGRPVVDVESVTLEGSTDPLAYTVENKHRIRLTRAAMAGDYWPTGRLLGYCPGPRRIAIRYTYGSPAPAEVQLAIDVLAEEFQKVIDGDIGECRLPDRVTSISREGMNMTLLDPQDFLDQGRTGIEEVDQALSRFNPTHARRPARVYGRANRPPVRTNTIQN
jgi:hypothetical protein